MGFSSIKHVFHAKIALFACLVGLYLILTLKRGLKVFLALFEGLGKHTASRPHTRLHIASRKPCEEV